MNYSDLFYAVKNYLQNDFPTNTWTTTAGSTNPPYSSTGKEQIDTLIRQAEKRIYNTVQIPALRKNQTGQTTAGNSYLSCPPDFLSVFSMAIVNSGQYSYLLNKDVNFIREVYPSPTTQGVPKYYAIFGPTVTSGVILDELSFLLAPTPTSAYTVELNYYYYPESIVDAENTWLGDNYSPALLYGTLVEGYIYMKGEQDMMAYYEKKFMDALSQLNRLGTGLERGDAYRDGQAKIKVNP